MKIKYSYMIKQKDRHPRLIDGEISESDIIDMIQKKYNSGDLPCPIHFNREDTQITITIDEVTV